MIENTLYTAEMRLCRYILDASDGDRFRDVMMDVAYSIGVSYRHLYRMMGVLCRDGILQKNQTGYRICDRARLQERGRSGLLMGDLTAQKLRRSKQRIGFS